MANDDDELLLAIAQQLQEATARAVSAVNEHLSGAPDAVSKVQIALMNVVANVGSLEAYFGAAERPKLPTVES